MDLYNYSSAARFDRTKAAVLGAVLFVAFTCTAYVLMSKHAIGVSEPGFIGDPAWLLAFHNSLSEPVRITVIGRGGGSDTILSTFDVENASRFTTMLNGNPPVTVVFRVTSLDSGRVITERVITPEDGWYEIEIK